MTLVKLRLNPPTAMSCVYVEDLKPCKEPPVGEMRGHYYKQQNNGRPWPMCERHLQPEMHPWDLRDKLFRWETVPEMASDLCPDADKRQRKAGTGR